MQLAAMIQIAPEKNNAWSHTVSATVLMLSYSVTCCKTQSERSVLGLGGLQLPAIVAVD